MRDDDTAYRVGAALAYLVGRMETFCGVAGADVLIHKRAGVGGIPRRMPAGDVLKAQARHYPAHRHLYPDDHRVVLDAHIALIGDLTAVSAAAEGFIDALSQVAQQAV